MWVLVVANVWIGGKSTAGAVWLVPLVGFRAGSLLSLREVRKARAA